MIFVLPHPRDVLLADEILALLSPFLKYLCFKTSLRVKLSLKTEFDLHENEHVGGTLFHMNALARRLVLIQRQYSADIFVLNYKPVVIWMFKLVLIIKFAFQVEEYFQDFDPLRHGSISRSQFRRCLSLMGQPNLTDEQFEVLVQYYRDPKLPGNVMWTRFLTDTESGE